MALAVNSSDFEKALNQQPLQVGGLTATQYSLRIDGVSVGEFSKEQLAAGINLAMQLTPMFSQATEVHQLTLQHNNIHFFRGARSRCRWRSTTPTGCSARQGIAGRTRRGGSRRGETAARGRPACGAQIRVAPAVMPARYYAAACQTDLPCPRAAPTSPNALGGCALWRGTRCWGMNRYSTCGCWSFPSLRMRRRCTTAWIKCASTWRFRFPMSTRRATGNCARTWDAMCRPGRFWKPTRSTLQPCSTPRPHRANRHPLQVPQGQSLDSLGTARQSARLSSRRNRPIPVADTELGRLGVAVCYDWLFPETIRQIAFHGAEVILRVSAYMDPWEPHRRWTGDLVQPGARDREHGLRGGCQPGAARGNYPPSVGRGAA